MVNEIEKIKNWENAIFASEKIQLALNYSDKIDDFKGLVEVKIKPKSYTSHKSSYIAKFVFGHFLEEGEDENIDDILRISSEKNIIVTSIIFISNKGEYHIEEDLFYH